ncbi:type II secretion system F family protein [Iamia majanohamensis]|uniref:Type II secretion system F family protein n=1 Tax=Iamia majanohamensis TaxID=467976 RepID=A0AAF0BV77_9ACTN|nr:type II secretion system F family protein [Iamia majanohamensis]WCO66505.1 type II secretion system F family protein [Iamia majanohamensis]
MSASALGAGLAAVLAVACAAAGRAPHPAADPRPGPDRHLRHSGGPWARALASAGVEGDPRRWGRAAVGSVVLAALLAGVRGGPLGAAAVALVVTASFALALRVGRGRGPRRADALLPDLLEHVARALRSGRDLPGALGEAGATVGGAHGHEAAAVVARVERGATLVAALRPWPEAHPRAAVGLAVAGLEVAAEAGGARARALDGIAATLRARAVVADETRALATQARASAAVMVALPVVVAALGSAADPRLARTLLGTPVGLACVAVAGVLDGVGAWWMHRVVDGAAVR